MIDHEYKITTTEIPATSKAASYFVAELSQIYLLVNGERVGANYNKKLFFGTTQIAAVLQASEAFRNWLKSQEQKKHISYQNYEEQKL